MSITLVLGQYPILSCGSLQIEWWTIKRGIIQKHDLKTCFAASYPSQGSEGLRTPLAKNQPRPGNTDCKGQWSANRFNFRQHFSLIFFRILTDVLNDGASNAKIQNWLLIQSKLLKRLYLKCLGNHALPPNEREKYEHHLDESRVVLIRTMISDHSRCYIAKRCLQSCPGWNSYKKDWKWDRIGGKADGMLLAHRILSKNCQSLCNMLLRNRSISHRLHWNVSFLSMKILTLERPKIQDEEQMRADYPLLVKKFLAGHHPAFIMKK
jgi:hypothetical protein